MRGKSSSRIAMISDIKQPCCLKGLTLDPVNGRLVTVSDVPFARHAQRWKRFLQHNMLALTSQRSNFWNRIDGELR